jgi:hypothetical protein
MAHLAASLRLHHQNQPTDAGTKHSDGARGYDMMPTIQIKLKK